MGVFALYRDYFNDVKWYEENKLDNNVTLSAGVALKKTPALIMAEDAQNILRAEKLFANKFSKRALYSDGDAYKVMAYLPKDALHLTSLNFPAPVALQSAYDASLLNLEDMKHWEFAPANAKMLVENGFQLAISHKDVKKSSDFLANLAKAVHYGLSEEKALEALTTNPAKYLGLDDYGTLTKGNKAFFFLTNEPLFDGGKIVESWIGGDQEIFDSFSLPELVGNYQLNVPDMGVYAFAIDYKNGQYKVVADTIKNKDLKANVDVSEGSVIFTLNPKTKDAVVITTHKIDANNFSGKAFINGELKTAQLILLNKTPIVASKKKDFEAPKLTVNMLPMKAYGSAQLPKSKSYLLTNATVWTNTEKGVMQNTDVYVNGGKVLAVGKNLNYSNVERVDATGMHLTTGIIDEHSHIGISKGVNEGGQAVSAEVTIEDVVNPWDVNIYRQLAGGVTAAQLLHGSANPIGGRSALVKLKYGFSPEEMLINGADGFIKFALGENVKQSNWGDFNTTRFPQTRMGVEQLMKDAFERALQYKKEKAAWKGMSMSEKQGKLSPRPNSELDIVLEILEGKRFVTCHSYVQSEINMLMKLAEEYGFRINTFTHILEGYKVADKMKEHGVGGSTFSDWWAYKFEVRDAIPYNAALLHENGVLTAINSDDAEMGRRLNQEAAKVVKYGKVSEEEAWKMVTLNPAKLLHLDNRMGSIAIGKDADLVLWSAHPLSIAAVAQKTFIDGALMFDRKANAEKEIEMKAEKNRLYQRMLEAIANGEKPATAGGKSQTIYHCMGEFH
jgi:imidazolonepropionase-like amidohydrolase